MSPQATTQRHRTFRFLNVEQLVEAQVRALLAGVPSAAVGSTLVAITTIALLWGHVPTGHLLVWTGAYAAAQIGRVGFAIHLSRRPSALPAVSARRVLRALTLVLGLCWGALPVALFPEDRERQIFLPFAAAGISGAGLSSLLTDRVSSSLFLVTVLVPLVIRLLMAQRQVYDAMAFLVSVYLVFLLLASRRSDRTFHDDQARAAWGEEQAQFLDRAQSIAGLGSFTYDPPTGDIFWSAEHLRLWQVTPGSETLSLRLFLSRIHPDERDSLIRTLDTALRTGGEYEWVHRIVRPDGSERLIHGRGQVTLDKSGRAVRVLGTVEDITERTRLTGELRELNEQLERRVAERTDEVRRLEREAARAQRLDSLGTLASGIAHDLNNALAPLAMGLDELRRRLSDHDEIDVIGRGLHRATTMVRQLLGFARGSSVRRPVDVKELLHELDELVSRTFPKTITIRVSSEATDLLIEGDATQLTQVLLNLCVNARDAMPGGGTLDISARRLSADAMKEQLPVGTAPGPWVAIAVSDTGTGIPQSAMERIFDPFFTTKEEGAGSGLGLSTARAIVRNHGGILTVSSEPGRGSVFTSLIPALGPAQQRNPMAAPSAHAWRWRGETVLLVDDDPDIRIAGQRLLMRLGCHPLLASDGIDALAKLHAGTGDIRLVVTDLQMPNMDGITLVHEIRRLWPALPVIVTSGRLDLQAIDLFKEMDVTTFVEKPYTEVRLAEALRPLLQPAPFTEVSQA